MAEDIVRDRDLNGTELPGSPTEALVRRRHPTAFEARVPVLNRGCGKAIGDAIVDCIDGNNTRCE
jgi:hypothetical protein